MIARATAGAAMLVGLLSLSATGQTADKAKAADQAKAKKALAEVQEFIGPWNVEGLQKVSGRTESWKTKANWGWKFDKESGDAWIVAKFDKDKYYSDAALKYLPAKKKYQLTLTPITAGAAPQVFEGDFLRGTLTVTRKDEVSGDVYRFKMNTAAEGIRMLAEVTKQDKGRGPFTDVYKLNATKEGESFAGGAKKPECIVTGGAATIAVSYMGKTYYVCCSGCRDEFNANPEKIIKEAAKKK
jgi:YHS domain-containing protein